MRVQEKHVQHDETSVDAWYKAWIGDTDAVEGFRRWVAGLNPDLKHHREAVQEWRDNPYIERQVWLKFPSTVREIAEAGLQRWEEMKARVKAEGWELEGEAVIWPQSLTILTPVLGGACLCKATARRKKTASEVYETGPAMVPGWTSDT